MNTGYFMSFTIFLALSSTEFCNQYIRTSRAAAFLGLQPQQYPLVTLRGYIVFWGCAFTLITLAIALWKQETDHYAEAQERKRQRHRRAKHQRTSSAAARSKMEKGGAGLVKALWPEDAADTGVEWTTRRAEIVTAYAKLWGVVSQRHGSRVLRTFGCGRWDRCDVLVSLPLQLQDWHLVICALCFMHSICRLDMPWHAVQDVLCAVRASVWGNSGVVRLL
jgi:hypothetical protein